MQQLVIKEWSIQNLLENKNLRQVAKNEWEKFRSKHNCLILFSSKNNLDMEVE